MNRFLYGCGLCVLGAGLSLYISIIDHSSDAWLCTIGFLAVGGFLWTADWILSVTEKPEYPEEE